MSHGSQVALVFFGTFIGIVIIGEASHMPIVTLSAPLMAVVLTASWRVAVALSMPRPNTGPRERIWLSRAIATLVAICAFLLVQGIESYLSSRQVHLRMASPGATFGVNVELQPIVWAKIAGLDAAPVFWGGGLALAVLFATSRSSAAIFGIALIGAAVAAAAFDSQWRHEALVLSILLEGTMTSIYAFNFMFVPGLLLMIFGGLMQVAGAQQGRS